MTAICIWQPKFSTREVLVATNKVRDGVNYLFFAGDRNHPDLYAFDGLKVKQNCRVGSNGKLYCYYIPLDYLDNKGELPEELKYIRDKEYSKFKNRK